MLGHEARKTICIYQRLNANPLLLLAEAIHLSLKRAGLLRHMLQTHDDEVLRYMRRHVDVSLSILFFVLRGVVGTFFSLPTPLLRWHHG